MPKTINFISDTADAQPFQIKIWYFLSNTALNVFIFHRIVEKDVGANFLRQNLQKVENKQFEDSLPLKQDCTSQSRKELSWKYILTISALNVFFKRHQFSILQTHTELSSYFTPQNYAQNDNKIWAMHLLFLLPVNFMLFLHIFRLFLHFKSQLYVHSFFQLVFLPQQKY